MEKKLKILTNSVKVLEHGVLCFTTLEEACRHDAYLPAYVQGESVSVNIHVNNIIYAIVLI